MTRVRMGSKYGETSDRKVSGVDVLNFSRVGSAPAFSDIPELSGLELE